MFFSNLSFLPILNDLNSIPDQDQLDSLSTFTPILISLSLADQILKLIPNRIERYIYDDLSSDNHQPDQIQNIISSIINLLDHGAIKVITDLDQELISSGLEPHRIIVKKTKSSNDQNHVCSSMLIIEKDSNQIKDKLIKDFISNHQESDQIFLFDQTSDFDPIQDQNKSFIHVVDSINLSKIGIDRLIDLFISKLTTDRDDGLYSTSVASPSSTLLGQVFSSKESIKQSIKTRKATYFSRSRNQIWVKGATSGSTQELVRIRTDCDGDCLEFQVIQKELTGFCHTQEISCFGPLGGLQNLESTLLNRLQNSVAGSYTNRLFNDQKLLKAKIMEEAEELCEAEDTKEVASEMADLIYFAMCRCISKGVRLADVERVLDQRALKVTRRRGDAKPHWEAKINNQSNPPSDQPPPSQKLVSAPQVSTHSVKKRENDQDKKPIRCKTIDYSQVPILERSQLLKRPIFDSETMVSRVKPIVDMVKQRGDRGLLEAVQKFDKFQSDDPTSLILNAPFPDELMKIDPEVQEAIDVAYQNILKFHAAQLEKEKTPLVVETMEGIVCSRFARPIDRVGLYVPGGTAVLPSTALMLAIPAQVAGCEFVSIATPPRSDGTISPEIMYIARKCGVKQILKAGGAHAVSALAYGTETVSKVDKIFGPGNQFVTSAKMMVSSDLTARVAIDMPAGPSEVLVIVDQTCNPIFVASDLLSQAEHGIDSQVILISIDLKIEKLNEIENQIQSQAYQLDRLKIIQESLSKSFIIKVLNLDQAFEISNQYGPEHLILHLSKESLIEKNLNHRIKNAGSVFIGEYSPESCGDYASGTNHSLPTSGYAKQYSGVSTLGFMKHITCQELNFDGLKRLSQTVIKLAELEGLDGHANAVRVRLLHHSSSS